MIRCRGITYEDEGAASDERFEAAVVATLDDWNEAIAEDRQRTEAKRAASGISPELLFIKETA